MFAMRFDLEGLPRIQHVFDLLASERIAFKAANAAAKAFQADVRTELRSQYAKSRIPVKWRFAGAGAMAYTRAKHAPRIEFGTGLKGPLHRAYSIVPRALRGKRLGVKWQAGLEPGQRLKGGLRKALKLPGGVFVKRVTHPGAPPRPFFYKDLESRKFDMLAKAKAAIAQKIKESSA